MVVVVGLRRVRLAGRLGMLVRIVPGIDRHEMQPLFMIVRARVVLVLVTMLVFMHVHVAVRMRVRHVAVAMLVLVGMLVGVLVPMRVHVTVLLRVLMIVRHVFAAPWNTAAAKALSQHNTGQNCKVAVIRSVRGSTGWKWMSATG